MLGQPAYFVVVDECIYQRGVRSAVHAISGCAYLVSFGELCAFGLVLGAVRGLSWGRWPLPYSGWSGALALGFTGVCGPSWARGSPTESYLVTEWHRFARQCTGHCMVWCCFSFVWLFLLLP